MTNAGCTRNKGGWIFADGILRPESMIHQGALTLDAERGDGTLPLRSTGWGLNSTSLCNPVSNFPGPRRHSEFRERSWSYKDADRRPTGSRLWKDAKLSLSIQCAAGLSEGWVLRVLSLGKEWMCSVQVEASA